MRVLVLADIRLYREGLADVLGRSDVIEVIGAAGDVLDALDVLESEAVDIAHVGLSAGKTLRAGAALARAHPETQVVALAIDEADDVVAVVEAGVAGYVPKDASLADLVSTVESVSRGEMPCSPRVAAGLRRRLVELARQRHGVKNRGRLTTRERQVLALVGEDLSNKEIAQRLSIEVTTVKNHVHNLLEKLQVHRRRDAVAVMRTEGAETWW